MGKRVVFVSPMCLLDSTSGAALSVHAVLESLAEAGYECTAFTGLLFDARTEVPIRSVLGVKAEDSVPVGGLARTRRNGVEHLLFRFTSTQGQNVRKEEIEVFLRAWTAQLERLEPDVVLTYGTSPTSQWLQNRARERGALVMFYLANAWYKDRASFHPDDCVVCPSEALKQHYTQALGFSPQVLRQRINVDRFCGPDDPAISNFADARRAGVVTLINPAPEKGLTLFLKLVDLARRERPDLTFLAVEGRVTRENVSQMGTNLDVLHNLWWLSNQKDMRRIYGRTSVLIFPSFCFDAAGRSIAEAQLSGIPVLASRRGGSPEQLNGGGFLFDVPERCTENYEEVPTFDEVRPWLDVIGRLMDDPVEYREASARAREAAKPFHPDNRSQEIVTFFDRLLQDREPGE